MISKEFRGVLLYSLFVLYLTSEIARAEPVIRSGPSDVTVSVGQSLLIPCDVEGDLSAQSFQWRVNRKYEENVLIYERPADVLHETELYNVTGKYNLYISKVNFTHAGKYACSLGGEERSADVVVIDKPILKYPYGELTDGDHFFTQCDLRYAASDHLLRNEQFPREKLLIGSDLVPADTVRNINSLDDGSTQITLSASVVYTAAMSGKQLRCLIFTENPEVSLEDTLTLRFKGIPLPNSSDSSLGFMSTGVTVITIVTAVSQLFP